MARTVLRAADREGPAPVGPRLESIYDALLASLGPQDWWPADDDLEMVAGAILTQSTSWRNVEKAIANLKAASLLSPRALAEVPEPLLAELVRSSGYYRVKARKLQLFARHLVQHHDGRLEALFHVKLPELRQELLSIWGVGPETADSIILYGARKPVFVVDAYTRRIFHRLGLTPAGASYDELQSLFMGNLRPSVPAFQEYHALIVALGKSVCRPTSPRCAACPLRELCPWPAKETSRALATSARPPVAPENGRVGPTSVRKEHLADSEDEPEEAEQAARYDQNG